MNILVLETPDRDATADHVINKMRRQRRRDTPNEVLIRRALFAMGYRYRIDIRPERSVPRRADIVLKSKRLAVFVDGCFWHVCPLHASWPKHNRVWWETKLLRNRERDAETTRLLTARGWQVLRFWEHEDPLEAALTVNSFLKQHARDLG